jgi:hypothetical protein
MLRTRALESYNADVALAGQIARLLKIAPGRALYELRYGEPGMRAWPRPIGGGGVVKLPTRRPNG